MASDAQEDSPEEKAVVADATAFDTGFDLGWEAGQNAIRDGMIGQVQEARTQGFKEGYGVGFKEGFQVGYSDAKPLPPGAVQHVKSPCGGC